MSHQSIDASACGSSAPAQGRPSPNARSPLHLVSDIDTHPVFAALDAAARQRIASTGRERALDVGEPLDLGQDVAFVLEGILGTFCEPVDVCVAVAGFGCVLGLAGIAHRPASRSVEALVPSRVFVSSSDTVAEALGQQRVMELSLLHTWARISDMEDEAACNASHGVAQRLARWLLRLHRANQSRDLALTQADLARLMGVQRTSVNMAARQLQVGGAARFARSRVMIKDVDLLMQSACACAA